MHALALALICCPGLPWSAAMQHKPTQTATAAEVIAEQPADEPGPPAGAQVATSDPPAESRASLPGPVPAVLCDLCNPCECADCLCAHSVRKPSVVAVPQLYYATDSVGQRWSHRDPAWLQRWVAMVNARRQPAPRATVQRRFQSRSTCPGGNCPVR